MMSKYILIGVLSGVCLIVLIGAGFILAIIIRHQRRLKYSITIIPLKTNKFFYLLLDIFLVLIMVLLGFIFAKPQDSFLAQELYNIWDMSTAEARLVLGILMVINLCCLAISAALTYAKSAVVNDGIYTAIYFLDWNHLYDFYFEKKGNKVIVSNNRNGALTLSGTSAPLKFAPADREKLKFLLNKNKNKFVSKN
ncbi:MAG: hypothetical protein GX756_06090 [Clostridiales bacterium]|nr:hypothetical protein [Clostridiales bacterium]